MDKRDVFIMVDPDVARLLAENDEDVPSLLASLGQDVDVGLRADPTADNSDGRSRDLVTVAFASAAVVVALTPLLKRAIDLLASRPVVLSEWKLVPIAGPDGKCLTDSDGRPQLQWVERESLHSRSLPPNDSSKLSLDGPLGIRIRFESRAGVNK